MRIAGTPYSIAGARRSHNPLWCAIALIVAGALLISVPLVLAKKFAGQYPVPNGKELSRCNPCPFNSINRPAYDITMAEAPSLLTSPESEVYLPLRIVPCATVPEGPPALPPPLRC